MIVPGNTHKTVTRGFLPSRSPFTCPVFHCAKDEQKPTYTQPGHVIDKCGQKGLSFAGYRIPKGPLNRQDLITDSGISAGCLDLLPEAAHVVNDHFPSLFRNTANGKLSSLLRNAVNSFYLSTFNHLFSPLISSRSLRRTFLNFFPSTRLFAYPFLDS